MSDQPWGASPMPPPSPVPTPAPGLPADARRFPHPEPTPYHLMLRTWGYSWWRPVVGTVICLIAFFVLAAVVFLMIGALWAAFSASVGFSYAAAWMLLSVVLCLALVRRRGAGGETEAAT